MHHATTCDGVCSHARGGAFALSLSSSLIGLVPRVLGAWSSYRLSFTMITEALLGVSSNLLSWMGVVRVGGAI